MLKINNIKLFYYIMDHVVIDVFTIIVFACCSINHVKYIVIRERSKKTNYFVSNIRTSKGID